MRIRPLLLLPMLAGLSGCYSLSCPAEFATPFERARFCGQGQIAGPAAHAIPAAAATPGMIVPAARTTVIQTEVIEVR